MQSQGSITDKDQSGTKTILTAMHTGHEEQNLQVSAQSHIQWRFGETQRLNMET